MMILPEPRKVSIYDGEFEINYGTTICLSVQTEGNAYVYAKELATEIESVLGYAPAIIKGTVKNEGNYILLTTANEGEPQGYVAEVTEGAVLLKGMDEAGLMYAVSSFRQLVREYGAFIPTMLIEDEPAIKNRGFNHDVTRGRIPTLKSLKDLADVMAFYKLNELQLNVEHTYMFQKESEIWRDDDPLTAEEILELDEYCRVRHIDLVPTIASFGHLYELLRSRTYSRFCELTPDYSEPFSYVERMRHHTVNVSDERTFSFLTDRIGEYMDLFSSKYVNICADETFDLGKGKSREYVANNGVKEVYIDFLRKLCDFILSRNRIPMYWGDIIIEKPEIINSLPSNSICLNWEYDPVVREDNLKKLIEAGAKNVYVCPGVQGWNHLINQHDDAYRNILGMCANGHKYNVRGVLNTDWGDLGHIAQPEFSYIGLIYGAAFSWSRQSMNREDINRRISVIHYLDASGTLVGRFAELASTESVNWWAFVSYKETIQRGGEMSFDSVMDKNGEEKALACLPKCEKISRSLNRQSLNLMPEAKKTAYAYMLMAEGQRLIAMACICIYRSSHGMENSGFNKVHIAEKLEWWFMRYKALWRSVSKESELGRLGEVIAWYADLLRDL